MNNIDHAHLAQLRPEKFDDTAVNEQIVLIQKTCDDVDPEIIAIVFHECNYNMQKTIARLQARDFEDGGWQKAKPNNKKKNQPTAHYHPNDQIVNGNSLDNSERSLSQRTSPASSLRDGHRRNDRYQYSSSGRPNSGRRGNDFNRHHFNSSNSRNPPRQHAANRTNPGSKPSIASESKPSETNPPTEEILPISTANKYDSTDNISQSSNFDHSEKKSSTRHTSSSIPQKPVSMHRTIHCSTEPIDIQFGDIQWKDSLPIPVTPTDDDTPISTALPTYGQNIEDHGYNTQEIQDNLLTTNEPDIQFLETTNQFSSSLSINDNTLGNNLSLASNDGTSHLSDHLTDALPAIPPHISSQPQIPIQIPITRLPPTSTPAPHTLPNNLQPNPANVTPSAFTPFNNSSNYSSVPRDYSQANQWNPQPSNYKQNSKASIYSTGTYPQQSSYQMPPQQVYLGQYAYPSLSPSLYQIYRPPESWSTGNYSAQIDTYPYPMTNYSPTYSNQQQPYHPPLNKYDQTPYDKEFFINYGQARSLSNDALHQQQQQQQSSSANTQPMKDAPTSSKLSPTAAVFSQGVPLTTSTSVANAYLNPVTFQMPNYVGDMSFQDRTLSHSSADTRDNRNGAPYGTTTNRNNYHYYGQQQQRVHHNNATGHLQQ